MEFLSACELKTAEGITLQSIVRHGYSLGMSYDDIENGLVTASRFGWVIVTHDEFIHLTEAGYVCINADDDNRSEK